MAFLPIVALTSLVGYYLNKEDNSDKKTDELNKLTLKQIQESYEIPNGKNIYSSNYVNEANSTILNKSLDLYKQSEEAAITGVLPPLFNIYGMSGNADLSNIEIPDSKKLSEIERVNRLVDVTKKEESPQLESRPMFSPDMKFKTDIIENNFSAFQQLPISQETSILTGNLIEKNISMVPSFESNIENFENLESNSQISTLTGLPLEKEHTNMVPFFGSNVKQNTQTFANDTILDLHSGNTKTFKHKQEIGKLFSEKPENIYGTPLFTSEIETDRFISSLYKQGEKPFQEEKIAAPISGTYENKILPDYKDVNELRPGNKPKESYEGKILSGKMGEVRGVQSNVNKNRPERFYEQGSDRLIVTTGQYIAKKNEEDYDTNFKPTSRQSYNMEYYGGMGAKEFLSTKQRIEQIDNSKELNFNSISQVPKRQNFKNDYLRNFANEKRVIDYGKTAITNYETERASTEDKSQILNPNVTSRGFKTSFNDEAKSTIKETTLNTDTTRNFKSSFDRGLIETHYSGISDFKSRTTNKETFGEDNYKGIADKKEKGMGYIVNKYDVKTTGKEIVSEKSEYQGNAKYANNEMSKENYKNAVIREKKEEILERDRLSGPQNFQISSGKNAFGNIQFTDNMKLKEDVDERDKLNKLQQNVFLSKINFGQSVRDRKDNDIEDTIFMDRMQPEIVSSQLDNNPFSMYRKKN
jgi:hypothetical protein